MSKLEIKEHIGVKIVDRRKPCSVYFAKCCVCKSTLKANFSTFKDSELVVVEDEEGNQFHYFEKRCCPVCLWVSKPRFYTSKEEKDCYIMTTKIKE